MSIVTMTSTVSDLTSGQTYRVRARTAELLVRNAQATKSPDKKITGANPATKEGKRA